MQTQQRSSPLPAGSEVLAPDFHARSGQCYDLTRTATPDLSPTITAIADQTLLEDAAKRLRACTVDDDVTPPAHLTLSRRSSTTALFTTQPAISGPGTLTFLPAPQARGSALVTVQAHDNGGTANGVVNVSAPQTFSTSLAASWKPGLKRTSEPPSTPAMRRTTSISTMTVSSISWNSPSA